MKTNMTHHARFDRANRLNYIVDTIGIGEVVCTYHQKCYDGRDAFLKLTSTGVIMVVSEENKIITAYIATVSEAIGLHRKATGRHDMPTGLYKRICKNEKLYIENGKMKIRD